MNKGKNRGQISPSLMCSDWLNMEKTISILEKEEVDWLHIDIMDGHFVNNIAFSIDAINQIKAISRLPLDIHMMVEHPGELIERMDLSEGDLVTFHYEIEDDVDDILEQIRRDKIYCGLALMPDTDLRFIKPYLHKVDAILLMNTVPGFYGKTIEEGAMRKIGALSDLIHRSGEDVMISVDGSVSYELASEMRSLGADIFVAGTSSVFGDLDDLSGGIESLRGIVDGKYAQKSS